MHYVSSLRSFDTAWIVAAQPSARPADDAPRPASHSEGPRQQKLEAAAESGGQHTAETYLPGLERVHQQTAQQTAQQT